MESLALENEKNYYTLSLKAWGMKEVDPFYPQRCLLLSVPGSPVWFHCGDSECDFDSPKAGDCFTCFVFQNNSLVIFPIN